MRITAVGTKIKVVRDIATITLYAKSDLEVRARNGDIELLETDIVVETFDFSSVTDPSSANLEALLDAINTLITT